MVFGEVAFGEVPFGEAPSGGAAITVSGEAWSGAATFLDGVSFGVLISGTPWIAGATLLDGTVPITILGEPFTPAATFPDGTVPLIVQGEPFALGAVLLAGAIVTYTDTSNRLTGRSRGGYALITADPPVATPPAGALAANPGYDKAIAYPTPTIVKGMPT